MVEDTMSRWFEGFIPSLLDLEVLADKDLGLPEDSSDSSDSDNRKVHCTVAITDGQEISENYFSLPEERMKDITSFIEKHLLEGESVWVRFQSLT
jgi:protein-tyrosine phosphatase